MQSSLSETSVLNGSVPFAVTVLSILPASTSFCCTVYVAVAVAVAFGASVVALRSPSTIPSSMSLSVIPLSVTLPVFSTVIVYVTVSPTFTLLFSEVFVTLIAGAASSVVTFAEAVPVTSASFGSLPVAVTVLSISPASTSACLTV